jgi:hypothetical protein
MGLLSFFGSAQVNLKMPRRKTFSIATTGMSQPPTIVTAVVVRLAMNTAAQAEDCDAITNHSKPFRCGSRSFLFR